MKTQMFSWINFETNLYVIFETYDTAHQYSDDKICKGKWIVSGPAPYRIEIHNVYGFREINEDDLLHNTCTNSYFPEKCCIMECYDNFEKKTITKFVVGTVKENEKKFEKLMKIRQEAVIKMSEIEKEIKNKYSRQISEIEEKFNSHVL